MKTKDPVQEKILGLRRICELRRWNFGLAESCTGGLLSALVTQVPGISGVYMGAVVSYARRVKIDVLEVPETLIAALGEVSAPVAVAMARGARAALDCDWAVAVTGIAGPSGGTPLKPVGTVCFAVSGPGFEESRVHQFSASLERHEIQRQAALFALDLLANAMR
jgi:nicotinamide-nucleotide amidase